MNESQSKFQTGDKVRIKHNAELGAVVVKNPKRLTDLTRIDGTPVGHYVDLETATGKLLGGYHEGNLQGEL